MTDDLTTPPPIESSGSILPPSGRARRALSGQVIAVGAAVIVLAAGATFGVLKFLGREPLLETRVPEGAAVFVKVSLRPSADQRGNLESSINRLPERRQAELVSKIENFIDDAVSETGLTYRKDVKPWIGGQLGFAVQPPAAGEEPAVTALATVKDEGAAKKALAKAAATSEEPFAFEVTEGVAYVGDSRGQIETFRSGSRRPLSGNSSYRRALSRVGKEGLLHVWVDAAQLAEVGFGQIPVPGLGPGAATGGNGAVVVRAEKEGIVVLGFQTQPPGTPRLGSGQPVLLEGSSAGLLASLSFLDFGTVAAQGLEGFRAFTGAAPGPGGKPAGPVDEAAAALGIEVERDLLSWMHGEFSVILGGITEEGPQAGVLIAVTDEAAADRTLAAVPRLPKLFGEDGMEVRRHPQGFDIPVGGLTIAVRRVPGRIVIATSPAYADSLLQTSKDSLAKDAVYRRVMGAGSNKTSFQVFARIDRIVSAVESLLPPEARAGYERDVAPFLHLFKALGLRATTSGAESEFRMLISLA